MKEFETKIIDIIDRTPTVKSFRMEYSESGNYKAGQFLMLTLKVGEENVSKYFSFSSSPTEKGYIEFTKRITESPFSKKLISLKIGDKVKVKMPFGAFTLDKGHDKIAYLSGGIGITPIRSMCKFATDMKLPFDIILLYGNKNEKEIAFLDDFNAMKEVNKNLHVAYAISCTEDDKKTLPCRLGHIDEDMIKKEIPDYEKRVFYICGPPGMVTSLADILKDKLSVSQDNIRLENFVGYQ